MVNRCAEYLQTYTRFSQTLRIFFASQLFMTNQVPRSHTIACIAYELSRYIPLFDELEQEQVLGKIIRLYTPGDHDAENPSISLPRLPLDDLFVTEQVPRTSHSDSPLVVGLNGSVDTHSPRTIDPTLVCK